MFYNLEVLSKKGKLARVWLAAHHDKKLTKPQILSANIEDAIDAIVGDKSVPMALRLLGHLLLGIAKLYARQSEYMLKDCNDAIVHIKLAFRPGGAKEKKTKANTATSGAITLRDPLQEGALELDVPIEELGDITLHIEEDDMEMLQFGGETPASDLYQASYTDITRLDPDQLEVSLPGFDPDTGAIDDFDPQQGELGPDELPSMDIPDPGSIEIPLANASPMGALDDPDDPMMIEPDDLGPLDPLASQPLPVDPNADQEDAAEARARRGEKRQVKVHSDRRTTTISADEMRNNLNNTEVLERDMQFIPTLPSQMERLAFEYADSDENFHQFSILAPAGVAPELSQLFFEATNMYEDLPQVEAPPGPDAGGFGMPQTPEPFDLPPDDFPDIAPPAPGLEDGPDDYASPPLPDTEVARRASSFAGPEPFDEGDSRFSVGPMDQSMKDVEPSQEPELVQVESFSKRTGIMHRFLERSFEPGVEELCYQDLVENKKRSTVAQTFFELLVLKSRDVIDLTQEEAFGPIAIRKTEHFHTETVQ